MNPLNKIAAAVSVATLAGAAHGTIITSSMTLNQLLSAPGGTFSGSFALNPLLAAQGMNGGTIKSATISAFGFSDTQINQQYQTNYTEGVMSAYSNSPITGYYSYSCGWLHTCYAPTYGYALYRNIDAIAYYSVNDTVADTMQLQSGGASASDTVDRSVWGNDTGYSYGNRNNGTMGYDSVQFHQHTTTDVYSGALNTSLSLSGADLLAMAQSGLFDFNVGATVGNFRLSQITISFDAVAAAVPEPESAALALAGLAALAIAARTRRRNRSPS